MEIGDRNPIGGAYQRSWWRDHAIRGQQRQCDSGFEYQATEQKNSDKHEDMFCAAENFSLNEVRICVLKKERRWSALRPPCHRRCSICFEGEGFPMTITMKTTTLLLFTHGHSAFSRAVPPRFMATKYLLWVSQRFNFAAFSRALSFVEITLWENGTFNQNGKTQNAALVATKCSGSRSIPNPLSAPAQFKQKTLKTSFCLWHRQRVQSGSHISFTWLQFLTTVMALTRFCHNQQDSSNGPLLIKVAEDGFTKG